MKVIKLMLIGLSFFSCMYTLEAQTTKSVTDFAISIFQSIKNNDFNSYIKLFPKPPFSIFETDGYTQVETFRVDSSAFEKQKSYYQRDFKSLINELEADGSLNDLHLNAISIDFQDIDKKGNFKEVFQVYLKLKNRSCEIRIEDIVRIGYKYLPEQLNLRNCTP